MWAKHDLWDAGTVEGQDEIQSDAFEGPDSERTQ